MLSVLKNKQNIPLKTVSKILKDLLIKNVWRKSKSLAPWKEMIKVFLKSSIYSNVFKREYFEKLWVCVANMIINKKC